MSPAQVAKGLSLLFEGSPGLFLRCQEQYAYGHVDWLLDYSGLSSAVYLAGRLPHDEWGSPNPGHVLRPFRGNLGRRMPIWTWTEAWSRAYEESGIPEASAIGAPWLYAMAVLGIPVIWNGGDPRISPWVEQAIGAQSLRRTLYVPIHSWERDVLDFRTVVARLSDVLEPSSTTVLLSWADFLSRETRWAFAQAGYHVECAGYRGSSFAPSSPMGDRKIFFKNLLTLFLTHEAVVSESMCTALLYAGSIGAKIGVPNDLTGIRRDLVANLESSLRTHAEFDSEMQAMSDQAKWLLGEPIDPRLHANEIRAMLGASSFRTPEDLRERLVTLPLPPGHEFRR